MIGDVNLFLNDADDLKTAEIEVTITACPALLCIASECTCPEVVKNTLCHKHMTPAPQPHDSHLNSTGFAL